MARTLMARNVVDDWIPEEKGGAVITRVLQVSAVETLSRREPMSTSTKSVPRSSGIEVAVVAKGADYGEDESTNDEVTITARKLGRALRFADEDIADVGNIVNIVATKQKDWATSYAKLVDNACLGTTAAANGTTVPFTSVYKASRTTNADTSYTADANYLATAGDLAYADLSNLLGLVEDSDYFDETNMIFIASPAYRKLIRNLVDDDNRPVFLEQGPWPTGGVGPTLMSTPLRWSLGCRTSATATSNPSAGNPLMIIANRDFMILGIRSGPESRTAGADTGPGFMSDEELVKMRARRGWGVGQEKAFGVLEKTDAAS
jgi:HK97 family phage major capsid protein